mmetsp:Transcript_24468/g.61542  ORF Transcript_24468/g.61542 Transcript_24468/m.61542 type:complete len:241 (-) Transcript_24468:324-1046(-)|eukprot:CAMPEP_0178998634 /NCGR_PEP_ID=MMETSP0795-20121207/9617_1 /TAXON_ID=88552 /ORGANISM="Amoebophrya sp., Strain Ameob2" /LENGTH=240 /DNA_ID=CAMNT_0020691325 /DNA_START=123 /DNA_END=845 /DNA_ORIENTATION=+
MPPRRARRNQNEPQVADQQAQPPVAPPPPPVAPPPEFPLFSEGRTLQMLHSALTDVEAKKLAKRAQRRLNNLVLNVWNLCAAKKTGWQKHGGIDEPVKAKVLAFMGNELAPKVNPKLSAAWFSALRERTREKYVAQIVDLVVAACERAGTAGNRQSEVKWSEMQKALRASLGAEFLGLQPSSGMPGKNWWKWLAGFLPSLPKTLEAAGLAIAYPEPTDGSEGGAEKKGVEENSVLKLSWR